MGGKARARNIRNILSVYTFFGKKQASVHNQCITILAKAYHWATIPVTEYGHQY